MSAPAGWYPTPDGDLRYWDGVQWTRHLAPSPAREASTGATPSDASDCPEPGPSHAVRGGLANWFGWGGLCLVAPALRVRASAASSCCPGCTCSWSRSSRSSAGASAGLGSAPGQLGVAFGVAMAFTFVGAATADAPETPVAAPTHSQAPSPPLARTPASTSLSATPTPSVTPSPSPTKSAVTPANATKGTALAAVGQLAVKGRAPGRVPRDQFGQAWFDTDRNGCDTRNDMLRRDLVDRDMKNWCKVLAGTRSPDPYTGNKIRFVLGGASEIDIDHVVPLSDAWQKGRDVDRRKRSGVRQRPPEPPRRRRRCQPVEG